MAYQYRGTVRDVEPATYTPPPVPAEKPKRTLKGCGTNAGYFYHKNKGTEPCQPCRDANNAWRREYRRIKGETTKLMIPLDAQCPGCGHLIADGVA